MHFKKVVHIECFFELSYTNFQLIFLLVLVRLGRTQLTLTNRTMTTFIIRWTPATGDRVTGYGIQYYPRSQPPASSEEVS